MNFITAYHTDTGICKPVNQDSLLIEKAAAGRGSVLLASVCDGMGGLSKGEVASGSMIRRLSNWFCTELPRLLERGFNSEGLKKSWNTLISEANLMTVRYGKENGLALGTTCTVFLAVDDHYYILNVGDSRIYLLSDTLYQLTMDQTYVQREIDNGRMSQKKAADDPMRNVLLQCIGAEGTVVPDFFTGTFGPGQCFLICSDGFTHMISPGEIFDRLCPAVSTSPESMKKNLILLTDLCKSRREKDNITSVLIKTV